MPLRTLDTLELSGQRVLVRADLNVPLANGGVADETRIRAVVGTINDILENGGVPVVLSHLGRPKGERDESLSQRVLAEPLSRALGGIRVEFGEDCIGKPAAEAIERVRKGQQPAVALLENLRFHDGEKENADAFADALAELGDVYVNDAFSAAHRAHASIVGLAQRLPSAAGRLMEQEINALITVLQERRRPFVALFGGAKVGTKFGALAALVEKTDVVGLGGGMANTVLHAQGTDVGASLYEADEADAARDLLQRAEKAGCEVIVPTDAVAAPSLEEPTASRIVVLDELPQDWMILDLGPASTADIADRIERARTVVWNGPLGAAENPHFETATRTIAEAIAERSRQGELTSVVGGGDTVAVLERMGVLNGFTHVSLAGGAFLEWLQGKELPGVAVLRSEG